METWLAKVLSLVLMTMVALIAGLLPIKLVDCIRPRRLAQSDDRSTSGQPQQRLKPSFVADRILDALNCFAGGVFLATSLLHLLPDVRKDIAQMSGSSSFPLAEFIVCVGFFVVMLLEEVLMQCRPTDNDDVTAAVAATDEKLPILVLPVVSVDEQKRASRSAAGPAGSHCHQQQHASNGVLSMPASYGTTSIVISRHYQTSDAADSQSRHGDLHNDLQVKVIDGTETELMKHKPARVNMRSVRSFVFLLALSTHTIFEGLALGLQKSTAEVWTLFAAVALHKAVMAFTSGLRFAETLPSIRRAVFYVSTFAAMSPLGIAIGLVVTETGQHGTATDAASAVLQGLATGTFVYVTFFEVLFEQLSHNADRSEGQRSADGFIKVLAVIVGFATISVLELFG